MEEDVKLTKLAKCAGCGAKVGAGVLAKLLSDIPTLHDDALLVGFDKSDDAAVYKLSDTCALVQTLDFFPPQAVRKSAAHAAIAPATLIFAEALYRASFFSLLQHLF